MCMQQRVARLAEMFVLNRNSACRFNFLQTLEDTHERTERNFLGAVGRDCIDHRIHCIFEYGHGMWKDPHRSTPLARMPEAGRQIYGDAHTHTHTQTHKTHKIRITLLHTLLLLKKVAASKLEGHFVAQKGQLDFFLR